MTEVLPVATAGEAESSAIAGQSKEIIFASEHILVIKLGALGDFLLSLGAQQAIKKHHPDARLTLLTTRPFVDIAQRSGVYDEILVDTRPGFTDFSGWLDLRACLNKGRFTRVYDLQMNRRTGIYYHLLAKKPEWSGIMRGASHGYTAGDLMQKHAIERHAAVLDLAGIKISPPDLSFMTSDISFFGLAGKKYVLLVPGSSPEHPEKRWPAARYSALALKFFQTGITPVLLGTSAEASVIGDISRLCVGAVDLSGRTSLYDIAELARGALAVIGNDTGPTHLAALAGAPTIALFGAGSNPALSAPRGDKVTVLAAESIADISPGDVMDVYRQYRREAAAA